MSDPAYEVNFDGLVGPTHNYAGLSYGNVASQKYGHASSNPKQAALQGLAKMNRLADLGVKQAVLPPHDRPDIQMLRRLGFHGSDASVLAKAHRESPALLAAVCSASSMWAANAATVSPSADTHDHRVHVTPANLTSHLHRSLESATTGAVLRRIFANEESFAHHQPLPNGTHLGDEGAANHTRLCRAHHEPGIEVFAYGKVALDTRAPGPTKFPARQSREASEAVAHLHQLNPDQVVFAQQNPVAIDAGVFHNDVIAVGNRNVLLYHHDAFINTPRVIDQIQQKYARTCGNDLICIVITADRLSLPDTVSTYLFNSQLVNLPDGSMALICPAQCQEHPQASSVIGQVVADDNPVNSVHYVDVHQSMQNGGGPACLRLRVVLTESQIAVAHKGVFFTEALHHQLAAWVEQHYRDRLSPDDLADPHLLEECRAALDELSRILGLGPVYAFQQDGSRPSI